MTLKDLQLGYSAKIISLNSSGALRQHFLDMGLIPGADVTLVKLAPMGDPMEIRINNYELTLRLSEAENITISDSYLKEKDDNKLDAEALKRIHHPGLGEGGKYHNHGNETPLDKDDVISFALAGNQNCGKTTLFNQLTGSNQHVGNFPGVTVDKKSGAIKEHPNTLVTDLPGIYSLSPYSDEEIVSRKFILEEDIKGIINIVDANAIERNLYLTLQLMELGIPMTLAVNMMDEVIGNGGYINFNKMEDMLGIPVLPISAKKNEGVDELVNHAIHVAYYQEKPAIIDFCSEDDYNGAIHRAIHGIMCLIEDHAKDAKIPVHFAATKIIENDHFIIESLKFDQNELNMIEHIVQQMEEECGLDRCAAMAAMRYAFINKVCKECVIKPKESIEHKRSEKIDKFLTGKFTAIPAFILIMALIFFLTFNVIGAGLQNLVAMFIEFLTGKVDTLFTNWNINSVIHSLVIDGIFEGVGSVLSFLPIIVTLFFFLSLLEDSGYMARIAFVMDKPLRKIGLSGKSIVPMLIGFGCTVPGVMSTRTLSSERDRKMTILLTPFMSCSAKLPIYTFLCSLFFGKFAWLVMVGLYFIGILLSIFIAFISKKLIFKGEAVPFVMELPNYRIPTGKNVLLLLWEKCKDFLHKAFTVIFFATIVIWLLQSFNFKFELVDDSANSILATISGWICYIFKPLGFGDYRFTTGLISGIMAKESVVSTLTILFGSSSAIASAISGYAAFSLLVFCLLYTPCIAALASIKRELGTKWMIGIALFQFAFAWCCSGLFSLIFNLMGVL